MAEHPPEKGMAKQQYYINQQNKLIYYSKKKGLHLPLQYNSKYPNLQYSYLTWVCAYFSLVYLHHPLAIPSNH